MAQYKCKKCEWEGDVNSRPRCLKCARENTAKWHRENRDKSRAQALRYDKKFRTTRRDEYNAKKRRYRKPETSAAQWKRRVKWLLEGSVTRQDLIEVYESTKGLCKYCGVKVKARFNPYDPRGFDHIKPRVKGGKHERSNIITSCGKCNARKGAN